VNLDKLVSFFMGILKRKFTGKVHMTFDRARLVEVVIEGKEDVAQFQ